MEKNKIGDALSFTVSYDRSSQSLIDTIRKTATASASSSPYWHNGTWKTELDVCIDINLIMEVFRWASDKDFEPINIKKLYSVIEEYEKEHR